MIVYCTLLTGKTVVRLLDISTLIQFDTIAIFHWLIRIIVQLKSQCVIVYCTLLTGKTVVRLLDISTLIQFDTIAIFTVFSKGI